MEKTQLMKKQRKEKTIPEGFLTKDFFKTLPSQSDVDQFLNDLHARLYEQLLHAEMDEHLGYEKHSIEGNNSGNSRNGTYPKTIKTTHGEAEIGIPRDRNGDFEPVIVPKHDRRGMSLEKLVISLYTKGMSVSGIEYELRNIYKITLSGSTISVITNKVTQLAQEWQNRPLERQ